MAYTDYSTVIAVVKEYIIPSPAISLKSETVFLSPSINVKAETVFQSNLFRSINTSNNLEEPLFQWPCADVECPPGQLPQTAPLYPGQFRNDAGLPLIGEAGALIDLFPDWFNKNKCSILSRITRVIGQDLDDLQRKKEWVYSKSKLNPSLNEPWIIYSSPSPFYINKISGSGLLIEYYNSNKGTWYPLFRVSNYADLMLAQGPAVYIDKNYIYYHNLERQIDYMQGTLVAGFSYGYEIDSNRMRDKSVFAITPGYQKLRWERWVEVLPEDLNISSGTVNLPYNEAWVSTPINPPTSGYIVRITKGSTKVSLVAKPEYVKNGWDILGERVGLTRKPFESNYEFKDRVTYRGRFLSSPEDSRIEFLIGTELDTVDFFEWDPALGGYSVTGNFPDFDRIIISGLKQTVSYREALSRYSSSIFTSTTKDWEDGYRVYVNGKHYTDTLIVSGGYVIFNSDIKGEVTAEYTAKYYTLDNGVLEKTDNLPIGDRYLVAVISNLEVNPLFKIKESRLFENNLPTNLLYDISEEVALKRPVAYNQIKWNADRLIFFRRDGVLPAIQQIPLTFEE